MAASQWLGGSETGQTGGTGGHGEILTLVFLMSAWPWGIRPMNPRASGLQLWKLLWNPNLRGDKTCLVQHRHELPIFIWPMALIPVFGVDVWAGAEQPRRFW